MKQYNKVLSIAGSDSGGGAGIQADIKTISACGCFATTAITAITAQNTMGVSNIYPIPEEVLQDQIRAVLEDIGADSVKIGMLHNSQTILAVKEVLNQFKVKNIVLDPVMVSTSGNKLLQDEAINTLKQDLIPMAKIITPNIPEAEILLGKKITRQDQLAQYARELSLNNSVSVFLKAGHLINKDLVDIFYNAEEQTILELKSKRVYGKNTHGTGCTLSSALASFLAKGESLNESAIHAKEYINSAIIEGMDYEIGNGHGPVKHFFKYWE